jgi:uncharacterized repeat protein (TIGR03803 family)
MSLVQGRDGNLYGTTQAGGPSASGTVFKITTGGNLTSLSSFDLTDGVAPNGLVLATDGKFYGTTGVGGGPRRGTVFKVTSEGLLTKLYTFVNQAKDAYASTPFSTLVQANSGYLYGTTLNDSINHDGTVFRITSTGNLTSLHVFNGSDGNGPFAGLIQGTDGNFYGTTERDDNLFEGRVFKMTPGGVLTTLHGFCAGSCLDGAHPMGMLVQATDGNFYGTTSDQAFGAGTVFKISPGGKLSVLYSFCSQPKCADGANPTAGLIQATDGNFYGTTAKGGDGGPPSVCSSPGCGTVFEITSGGTLTKLHSFAITDGAEPAGGLVQGTDGKLYGTTSYGGTEGSGQGTVFSLDIGLGPFVRFVRDSGKVGTSVQVLGQGFTSSTTVSFSGAAPVSPSFVSSTGTYLTAAVPSGATTGLVSVTTSNGTLTSNQKFRVIPQITNFSPPSGPVGTSVTITGVSLSQTTKVTFGGVKAAFTVKSDTQVTATVPSGAATGRIAITTPGGTAKSATNFNVTQ